MSLGSDLQVLMSVSPILFADLTDVTLADEDNNSISIDGANRAILSNLALRNTSYAACWPKLELIRVVQPGSVDSATQHDCCVTV